MDARQYAALEALHRGQLFLDSHDAELEHVNRSPARAKLDHLVRRIEEGSARQADCEARLPGLTQHIHQLRSRLLRHHLGPIITIVRDEGERLPERQTLRMPPKRATNSQVITFARMMVGWLPAHRELLVAQHLPADFIEQLQASVEALEQAITARDLCQMEHFSVTKNLACDVEAAWAKVRVVRALIEANDTTSHLSSRLRLVQEHAPRLAKPADMAALPAASEPVALPAAQEPLALPNPTQPLTLRVPVKIRGLLRRVANVFGTDQAA